MVLSMATLDEQIAGIETALASGAVSVEYDGKKTTFRSQAEMLATLSRLKAQRDGRPRPRVGLIRWSRGDQ